MKCLATKSLGTGFLGIKRLGIKRLGMACVALALVAPAVPANAGEAVNLILNWTPTADHSPFYYAKAQGWYEKAGIDLTIEVGKGSGVSSLKVGSGGSPFGIADLATMLVAQEQGRRRRGADEHLRQYRADLLLAEELRRERRQGFSRPQDRQSAGRRLAGDVAGLRQGGGHRAGCGQFRQCRADRQDRGAEEPYRRYHQRLLQRARSEGDRVRQPTSAIVNWKDIGLNPYGNSLIVNGAYLEKNPKLAEDFVKISQKAFAACVADVAPCLKALLDQVSGLDKENQERQWERIKFLMTDDFTTTKALGWIDAERMKKDYELVQTYLGMEKPFDGRKRRLRPSCSIPRSRWMRAR